MPDWKSIPHLTWKDIDRFESKFVITAFCWEWIGGASKNGYGVFWLAGQSWPAHRIAYNLYTGAIPQGKVIDHLCRNPACVNPVHLEAVTPAENVRRGALPNVMKAIRAAQKVCKHGHEYTPENTAINRQGSRYCRTCHRTHTRQWMAEYRAKLKQRE